MWKREKGKGKPLTDSLDVVKQRAGDRMLKLLLASDEEVEAKKEIFQYRITRRGDVLALANPVDSLGCVIGSVIILLRPQKSGRRHIRMQSNEIAV
jgi:hypothetical protein